MSDTYTSGSYRFEGTWEVRHREDFYRMFEQVWDEIPGKPENLPGKVAVTVEWEDEDEH